MKPVYANSPKTFSKFVHFLSTILFFICCLFCITAFFYVLSMSTTEKSQYEQIEEKRVVIDTKISQELQNYLYNNLNRSVTSVNIFSTFFKNTNSEPSYFQKIRIDLFDHYLLKQDILNDIVLFRSNDEAFTSATRAGYDLESTYSHTSVNYVDLHELVALEPLTTPALYMTANSCLYYIFPVYQQTSGNKSEYLGFAALHIDSEAFFDTGNLLSPTNAYGTSLILKDDKIIYVQGENALSEQAVISVIDDFTALQSNDNSHHPLRTSFASTEYSFYHTKSVINGLTYLYYEPIVNPYSVLFDFENNMAKLYWVAVMLLLILFLFFTFQKLISLRRAYVSRDAQAPGMDINETKENYVFKKTIDLLYGNIDAHLLDDTLCHILDVKKPNKYTSCILIEPEPLTILKMAPEQVFDFMAEITESVRMNLEVTSDTNFALINYPQHKITCILNSNGFLPGTLAHNILLHLESVYNSCHFNVFCTSPAISALELQRNYAVLAKGLKYSYIYNYSNLFTQDSIERFEATDELIDAGFGAKIRSLFREHNFDEIINYLTSLPASIRQKGCSYSRVYDHYRSIFFNISAYCNTNYADYPYKDIPATDLMNQFESIDEATLFLKNIISSLKTASLTTDKEQGDSISKKFIDRIVEYVDEHIVDVSLNNVAARFNVSAAHLSRVFKESAGINFSDYVAEKKLQKAVELLLDENNYNIGDIAKILGYNTPAYFSRKFKEHFDLTPAMYRKQYMTDTK